MESKKEPQPEKINTNTKPKYSIYTNQWNIW